MISVVFHPFGARAFFDMPAYKLHGLIVSADDLNIPSLKELEDRIFNASDDSLCIRLIESFLISQLKPFKEYNYKRMAATMILEEHPTPQSVDEYAHTLGISPDKLNALCKQQAGISAKQYILDGKVIEAKRLLLFSRMNMNEIAYRLGFEDSSYFARIFRKKTSLTPTEFLKKYRKEG